MTKINITITTYNRIECTKECIRSLKYTSTPFELTVVDNGSSDGSVEYLKQLYSEQIITRLFLLKRNMGVAVAANLGWSMSDADYYVKLDNDIIIKNKNWLKRLVNVLDKNKLIGAAAYKFLARHETKLLILPDGELFHEFNGLGGACVAIPRRVHQQLGYWNEDYGAYGYEDLDYGNRIIISGMISGYCDDSSVVQHVGHDSYVDNLTEERKKQQVESKASGKHLYLLNKFLFENKIRPLYMKRKYLCQKHEDRYSFRLNPEYKGTILLLNRLKNEFEYELNGDRVSVDINKLKSFILP